MDRINDEEIEHILEILTEGERAHLFNKLLKNEYYSPYSTSIARLEKALKETKEAQEGYSRAYAEEGSYA